MTRRTFLYQMASLALLATGCGAAPTVTPTPTRQRAAATATPLGQPTTASQATATTPTVATKQAASPTPAANPVIATATPASAVPTRVPATPIPGSNRMASPDYGVHVFLGYTESDTQRDVDLAKNGGFTWVKQRMDWDALAPDEQGQLKPDILAKYDGMVNTIAASGLKLIVRLGSPPKWAARLKGTIVPFGNKKDAPANPPPDDLSDTGPFANFLFGLAKRYQGKVAAWQIWNEPNLYREWGTAPDPAEYGRLLRTATHVIKVADPNMLVISAGMSPTGTVPPEAMPDDMYIDQMYQSFANRSSDGYFDVLGAHGAGYKASPDMDPAAVAKDPTYGGHRSFCFRRVEDLRAVMEKNGDAKKQVALLEFGWEIDGGEMLDSSRRWYGVTREKQAEYIVGAYKWAKEHWPWMGVMTVIYLLSPDFVPTEEYFWWGITEPNGTPRPAYTQFKAWRAAGN